MAKPVYTRSDYEWSKKHMHGGRDFPATIIPDEEVESVHRRIREGRNPRFVLPPDVMRNGKTANDKLEELLSVKGDKPTAQAAKPAVQKAPARQAAKQTVRAKAPTVVARRAAPTVRRPARRRVNAGGFIQTVVVLGLLVLVWVVLQRMQGAAEPFPVGPTPTLPGGYLIATLL